MTLRKRRTAPWGPVLYVDTLMTDTPEPSQSPLAFVPLPELVAEILRRSSSICLSLIPIMDRDQDNVEENALTVVEGRPTDLAWMTMLITTEIQLNIMRGREIHPANPDDSENEEASDGTND